MSQQFLVLGVSHKMSFSMRFDEYIYSRFYLASLQGYRGSTLLPSSPHSAVEGGGGVVVALCSSKQ
jgi:hypothetical protein